jgi:hypothetical protein
LQENRAEQFDAHKRFVPELSCEPSLDASCDCVGRVIRGCVGVPPRPAHGQFNGLHDQFSSIFQGIDGEADSAKTLGMEPPVPMTHICYYIQCSTFLAASVYKIEFVIKTKCL